MNNIVLPDSTIKLVKSFESYAPHAILLTGPAGIGLGYTARLISGQLGTLIDHVKPETKTVGATSSINVETVRKLYERTRGKRDSTGTVIIEDADTMNHSAQNALLKLLEEPAPNMTFILTSHKPDALLPTIRSRVQSHAVARLSESESRLLIKRAGVSDVRTISQLLFAASGLPARLYKLASDPTELEAVSKRMKLVRMFIENGTYKRLVVLSRLGEDRTEAIAFIDDVINVLRYSIASSGDKSRIQQIDKLLGAREALVANGNIRLQLMWAVV